MIVDLRPDSPTFGKWFGVELTADNRLMMFVPHGFAHGIIDPDRRHRGVLSGERFYAPEQERGVRWNDPRFGIEWPTQPVEISRQGRRWPDFDPAFHGIESLRGLT